MVYASKVTSKHWLTVTSHFTIDMLLYVLAFILAVRIRFGSDDWLHQPGILWPGMLLGAFVCASATYICGFYSPLHKGDNRFRLVLILGLCHSVALVLMLGLFYVNYSTRIGRGVMAIGAPLAFALSMLHHFIFGFWRSTARERVVLVVSNSDDESEATLLEMLGKHYLEFVGLVAHNGYKPSGNFYLLGDSSNLDAICRQQSIDRVVCSPTTVTDKNLYKPFLKMRYTGVEVIPLIALCEEAYQYIPVELITPSWLISASTSPHMLYIKKLKRAFDVIVSLTGLLLSAPLLLLGIILVRVTSKGPIFFRQIRCGRFGREFTVIKLRSMRVDAEKDGAVWAQTNDPRVTPVGNMLRKYRIDELPQLFNVLRGDMTFVGPRPERPEFIEQLSEEIPFFQERLLVQPGITGWAQVSYPYGSTVEDARRKLEYDLYYMKHMSILMDIFILLDTVRIILRSGLGDWHRKRLPDSTQTIRTARTESAISTKPKKA